MKPQTIWASVVVVFILVASATSLVILEKDVNVVLTLAGLVAVPVLGAFGVSIYHKLEQVKESSNGTNTRILEANSDTTTKILEMQARTQEQWQRMQEIQVHTQEQWQRMQDQLTTLALAITPPAAPASPAKTEEEKTEEVT